MKLLLPFQGRAFMNALNKAALYFVVTLVLALVAGISTGRADICKWVDENGTTHYAERCPEDVAVEDVPIADPLPEAYVEEARKRSESLIKQGAVNPSRPAASRRFHSLPLEELGPLPGNTRSAYLQTLAAQYKIDSGNLKGQFFLSLQASELLEQGTFIEVHFPNPANPSDEDVVGKVLDSEGGRISVFSPESSGFKCWNYEVEVRVYADESRSQLIDTHYQLIQSRLDLGLVNDRQELANAIAYGKCPTPGRVDFSRMTADELDELCETAREKRLKPLREARIEQCKAQGDKSDEYCENYWADFGDAARTSRFTVRPALFYDLPECIAAKKAREERR